MVNILIVEAGTGYGGSSSYLFGFLKCLDRDKFYPTVAFYNYADGPNIDKIRKLGIKTIFINKNLVKKKGKPQHNDATKFLKIILYLYQFFGNKLPTAFKIAKIIKQSKVHVILLNAEVHYHIPGVIAAKLVNIPCFVRKSGVGTDTSKRIRRFFSRFVDVFISSCIAETDFHIENKWPCKKMVTIYEGVDIDFYSQRSLGNIIRKELGISLAVPVIGSISRMEEGKGHDDLIKAAYNVVKTFPDAVFLIVGDDLESQGKLLRNKLEAHVKALGLNRNVIFAGWRTDILDILNSIDIFVHCPNSWLEAMGIATLEAMACGKPLVITNNCGLAETTIDGYNGYVVPKGDYKAIADKLISLLGNSELVKEMGNNSLLRAREYFNIKSNTAKIERLLEEEIRR